MTEAEALTELTLLVAADEEPVLDAVNLESILAYGRRPDAGGNVYADTDWDPTWDLNSAAAEGWRRKASIAAGRFSFAEDGQRFDRAAVYAHCTAQAQVYSDRVIGSIKTVAGTAIPT